MSEKIGKTEHEQWADQSLACRKIVDEILRFGVNQKQILQIINLLALELEDRQALEDITCIVKSVSEESVKSSSAIIME